MSSPEPAAGARAAAEPGAHLLAEIREQPQALRSLLEHEREYARVAATARDRGATTVRMVGHGSSDNAAAYGVYAFGLLPGWTALRDSITLSVYYGAEIEMAGSTAIALSQSGRTIDVVDYLGRARSTGAFTVALTNEPASNLAGEAEAVLPLGAGTERSVAATKTYLNQVAALGLLAAHAAGEGRRFAESLRVVSGQMEDLIPRLEQLVPPIAVAFTFVGRMFVIGRGPEFATAREIALKLLETCRIAAEPLTATDLAHGPRLARSRRRGRGTGPRRRGDDRRERQRRRRDPRRVLSPPHAEAPLGVARPPPLGRSGSALRVGSCARERPRPGPARGAREGDFGALAGPRADRCCSGRRRLRLSRPREAVEHQRDPDQLAGVDEGVRARPGQACRKGDDERSAADPR
ncbi:MAG: SIS domain-containing protein, partial [Actinobacteria bacterium]